MLLATTLKHKLNIKYIFCLNEMPYHIPTIQPSASGVCTRWW